MTTRKIGSTTYTQSFDVENRLIQVTTSGSSQVTQFAYDADGQRFRTEVAPANPAANDSRTVTTYPFPDYEVEQAYTWQYNCTGGCRWKWELTNSIIRRTYFLGGQAVATHITGDPTNNGLFYLHGDHLGSTSLLTYGSSPGNMVPGTETRYLPYGTHRLAPTTQLTERDYTGQKENLELGLLYYNARFYVPGIGRFANADTIVPDPGNPQQLNRYAYVLGNPIRLTDPTGHYAQQDVGDTTCDVRFCGVNPYEFDGTNYRGQNLYEAGFTYEQIVMLEIYWLDTRNGDADLRAYLHYSELNLVARTAYDEAGIFGSGYFDYTGLLVENAIDPELLLGIVMGIGSVVSKGGGQQQEGIGFNTNVRTNRTYTISTEKMAPHMTGSTTSGDSQFLYNVDAYQLVTDAAQYADTHNLWNNNNQAKIYVSGPVGVLGRTGELTNWVTVTRTDTGYIHAWPSSAP